MSRYDYLIVGAGFFGATCAHLLAKAGKHCLVIDKRHHIAGNAYTEEINNIHVHKYGAHIFHTKNKTVWDFVNKFAEFNHYRHSVVANYKGEIYNLPFNMNTFNRMWGVITPKEARIKIDEQRFRGEPKNLEEQAISLIGVDIYQKLIKEYTEKQWGRSCKELPTSIIKRIPVRYNYSNDYFDDPYQGVPICGYKNLVKEMLNGTDIELNRAYKDSDRGIADYIIYTGPIDEFYDYRLGVLEYRSLKFETEYVYTKNYQGCSVMNYTSNEPYTRIIEHKHFEFGNRAGTIITREYPSDWNVGDEPYYPISDEKNTRLHKQYLELADNDNIKFGGRLGLYRYLDMDKVIEAAIDFVNKELQS